MDVTFKSSDITTSSVLAASDSDSDRGVFQRTDERASSGVETAQKRKHLTRAEQERILEQLLQRAGMSSSSASSPSHLPDRTTAARATRPRPRLPSAEELLSSDTSSGSIRIAHSLTEQTPSLTGQRLSSSSAESSASGRLSPTERRERDAVRLSKLLDSSRTQDRASSRTVASRSRPSLAQVGSNLLADASWDMEDEKPVPATSLSARIARTPSPPQEVGIKPPSASTPPRRALLPATARASRASAAEIKVEPGPDAAMSDLEAEYEALRRRLDDAKRRFSKWHGVVSVKVQEDEAKRRMARSARRASRLAPPIQEATTEDEEANKLKDAGEESKADEEATDNDDSQERMAATSMAFGSNDDEQDGPPSHSTSSHDAKPATGSPTWIPRKLLPPKPVLSTTLTLSVLWTCGYLLTLLQWQMQQQQHAQEGAYTYTAAEQRWMSEYYDPMYLELYGDGPVSSDVRTAGTPGLREAVAGVVSLLGGLSQ